MSYDNNKIFNELKGWDNGKYFGQWETDRIIETYFSEGYVGKCIEVGAANGVKGSNTLYFEERGWDVLCIEPNPAHKESLEKYRKFVKYFACSDKKGVLPLNVFKVGENNIMSSVTSLNPDTRLLESHKEIINESYTVDVEVESLTSILENFVEDTPLHNETKIDFISVDTEGTEIDVLKGFDFEKFDVKLFVVENNYEDSDIEEFMLTKGYVKDQRYKINEFYIKK